MKSRTLFGMCVGLLGVGTAAMGGATLADDEDPVAIEAYPGEVELGSFSCGAMCNGSWHHVQTCYSGQFCCGYVICRTGVSSSACCNQGTQSCSWDGYTLPPPAIYCINNP